VFNNVELVLDFCRIWSRRNSAEIVSYFADDAVYHNLPQDPLEGRAAIKAFLDDFFPSITSAEFEILHNAAEGDVVFTERVDRFETGGKKVALPVAGVFEVKDGKIVAWRDYFDMATWTGQMGGA
jgi:limonene-1,2-epoxide hydrolase